MGELKPCPFCGTTFLELVEVAPIASPRWRVVHQHALIGFSCFVSGPIRDTAAEATAAWNTRTPPTGQSDETVIDLDAEFWRSIKEAAEQSSWIPKEHYFMNDWVSDCCDFLRTGNGIHATSQSDEARVIPGHIPPFLSAPTFDDHAEQRVCINGCLYLRADFAGERQASAHAAGWREGIEEAAIYADRWETKRLLAGDTDGARAALEISSGIRVLAEKQP